MQFSAGSLTLTVLSALVLGAAGPRNAHAGPALDDAVEWEQERTDDVPATATQASVTPRAGLETVPWGPRGDAPWLVPGGATARHAAHIVSRLYREGAIRWRAGFAWRDAQDRSWSLDGTMVALGLGAGELYASVERRHWGPGRVGSLILDGAAPALPAVGWRREGDVRSAGGWLRWVGPWSADVFVARLQGHAEPARPLLIGTRLQFEPVPGLELGLARTMQWGGANRDQSLRSLVAALIGRDNVGSGGVDAANEPGNQLAGVDWRWTPDADRLPSFYGQIVGEDEAGLLPSSNMLLLGLDFPWPVRGGLVNLFVEAADTVAGSVSGRSAPGVAYRHHVYRQGYTHAGVTLGHPIGGDVRLASLGAVLKRGHVSLVTALSTGRAAPQSQRFATGGVRAFNLAMHVDRASNRVGLGLWWARDRAGPRGEAQLWWQHRN